MPRKPNVIKELENFTHDHFPKFILNVLIKCGFDNKNSIKLINEESIKILETYVNENKNILKNTNYKSNIEFKFAIGHKLLLLNLPQYLENYEKSLSESKKQSNKKDIENISPLELKKDLLNKLQNYTEKFKFDFIVSDQLIEELDKSDSGVFKCRVKCCICGKSFACLYKKNWCISNFTNHIKQQHPPAQVAETPAENLTRSIVSQFRIQRIVNKGLASVLNT